MKKSLNWHRECLANSYSHLIELESRVKVATENFERSKARYLSYQAQIGEAERRKLDAFDSERFLKGNKKKSSE